VVGAVASMTEANNEADSLQTILSGLVDEGSTEELVFTIQMSTPLEESIDSSQIATLQTLAIHTKTLPGAYARNILIKKGALQYEEPVLLATTLKQTKKWQSNDPSHGNYQEFFLKVYPNPANHYFIVEYRTERDVKPGSVIFVTVTDISGHEVLNFLVKRNFDQVVVPTDNLPAGTYIISLKLNGKQKDQVKLIINK